MSGDVSLSQNLMSEDTKDVVRKNQLSPFVLVDDGFILLLTFTKKLLAVLFSPIAEIFRIK